MFSSSKCYKFQGVVMRLCLHTIGHFTVPVSCLIEPHAHRKLRPVNDAFVKNLKAAMKSNPCTDAIYA